MFSSMRRRSPSDESETSKARHKADPAAAPNPLASALALRAESEGSTTASSPVELLAPATQAKMEGAFNTDFSKVHVYEGENVGHLGALAYAQGENLHFAAGHYRPGTSTGDGLIAHELAHVVQQRSGRVNTAQHKGGAVVDSPDLEAEADRAATNVARGEPVSIESALGGTNGGPLPIQCQPEGEESTPEAPTDTAASWTQPTMGQPPDLGKLAGVPVESRSTRGVVDVPICEIYQRKPPFTPMARLAAGAVVVVKGFIKAQDREPLYVVEYHGRMLGTDKSEKIEGLMRLFDLAVSENGAAPTTHDADWSKVIPVKGTKLDATKDAEQIKARDEAVQNMVNARANIHKRPFTHVKAKPNVYTEGRYYRSRKDTAEQAAKYEAWLKSAVPALATGPDDPRLEAFRDTFPAEGNPSDVMTYDMTNITWGVGFSGHGGVGGVGLTEQLMVRLFNQDPATRQVFWDAGVSVTPETLLVVVDIARKVQLIGFQAERYIREQEDLLSLLVNIAQGEFQGPAQTDTDSHMRQRVYDAQFETFINSTLRGLDLTRIPNQIVRRLAVHANHAGLSGARLYGISSPAAAVEVIRQMLEARDREHLLGNVVNNLGAGTY